MLPLQKLVTKFLLGQVQISSLYLTRTSRELMQEEGVTVNAKFKSALLVYRTGTVAYVYFIDLACDSRSNAINDRL